jgi:hypothetical protein
VRTAETMTTGSDVDMQLLSWCAHGA